MLEIILLLMAARVLQLTADCLRDLAGEKPRPPARSNRLRTPMRQKLL